jgi:hypothetical protein
MFIGDLTEVIKPKESLAAEYEGWKVFMVEGKKLRKKDTPFIGGDNPAADSSDVPKKTIWIEKMLDQDDEDAFLVHELVEYYFIEFAKNDYEHSHNKANDAENRVRNGETAEKVYADVIDDEEFRDIATGLSKQFASRGKRVSESEQKLAKTDVTQTPAFKAWFGNSKVVDSQGKPLKVYHGTNKNFKNFDESKQRGGTFGKAFYFSPKTDWASSYAQDEGASIIPVYLMMANPWVGTFKDLDDIHAAAGGRDKTAEYLKKLGHDGGILTDSPEKEMAVFSPSQIKSAVGNKGTFNKDSPDLVEHVINETYTTGLATFLQYLKAGLDPYDFAYMLEQFFEDENIEIPEGFDPDSPFDFMETPEFNEIKRDFISWLENNIDGSDCTMPTYMFLTGAELVPRQTWLVHFSNDADDIFDNGFKYGAEDFTQLGLTTHFTDKKRLSRPGWNFAFKADSRYARTVAVSGKYGKHAVLFQSAGVEAAHSGDEEYQVVFWGPNVKERFLLTNEDNSWNVTVGQRVLPFDSFQKAVDWVIKNHRQYRYPLTKEVRNYPTPKKDRERLLAKPPEPRIKSMVEADEPKWGTAGGRFITPKHKEKKKPKSYEIYKSIPTNPPQAVQVAQVGEAEGSDRIVYHVTSPENANSIKREGFYGSWGDAGHGVYFWTDIGQAEEYAEQGGWDGLSKNLVILKLTLSPEDVREIVPESTWKNKGKYRFIVWHPTPEGEDEDGYRFVPSKIEIVKNKNQPFVGEAEDEERPVKKPEVMKPGPNNSFREPKTPALSTPVSKMKITRASYKDVMASGLFDAGDVLKIEAPKWISIDRVIETQHNNRKPEGQAKAWAIANSIRDDMTIPALWVNAKDQSLLDGHHRLEAMRKMGWKLIPVQYLHLRDL